MNILFKNSEFVFNIYLIQVAEHKFDKNYRHNQFAHFLDSKIS